MLLIGTMLFIYLLGSGDSADTIFQSSTQITAVAQKDTPEVNLPAPSSDLLIKDGEDVQTGLLAGEGLQLIKVNCSTFHSSALILQNRFTRKGWHEKIVWLQETQGLWCLGKNEDIILD